MKLKKTIAISILTFGLSILFFNNIHSYDWPWEYIKSTVISGGTLSSSEGNSVEHGVITEHGYQDLYEQGITDAEIASWYSEAAALNNGGDKPSTHSTADSSSSDINNNDTTSATDKTVNNSSQNSSNSSSKVTYTDEEIESAWVETNRVESTCTEAGYIEYTNSLTKETKTEELELAKHQYEETERTEPNCTEDGTVTYTCSVCGNTYDETLPATGHSYEWVTTKEVGLFTDGLEEEVCSVCGEKSGATHTLAAKIANSVVLLIICGIIIVTVGASSFILLHKRQAKNVLQSKKS